jgi:hypothetical protein
MAGIEGPGRRAQKALIAPEAGLGGLGTSRNQEQTQQEKARVHEAKYVKAEDVRRCDATLLS